MNIKFSGKVWLLISIFCLLAGSCTNTQTEIAAVDKEPTAVVTPTSTPTEVSIPDGYVEYLTQSGDTLAAIAAHFGVEIAEIESEDTLDPTLLINAGKRLLVRDVLEETTPSDILFQDAAIVFSPAAVGFDVHLLYQ